MKYKVGLSKTARKELKDQSYYYESLVPGLGKRFNHNVRQQMKTLAANPHLQVRYARIRCMPVPGFPFMMHYSLNDDERAVLIHAILHTSRSPLKHWNSGDWQVNEDAAVYLPWKYDMEFVYLAK